MKSLHGILLTGGAAKMFLKKGPPHLYLKKV